jgi:hypothetical protein
VSPDENAEYCLSSGADHPDHPAENDSGKRRPNYMPTRGLAAVLNQGLATLGEKLGEN